MENDVRKLTIEDLLNILADRFAVGLPDGHYDFEVSESGLQKLGDIAKEHGILNNKD